ncbi:cytohesin-interacting protein isoform X4 [Motacilla alba alba]|uniref:cytohesin-interacting protein isoform X4 n=1 Tax=Motacilla alba alba TaxID=1094192 RepID=UPI0018D4E3A8|nr:cytohesin-interacting protein isoform X4 [Motacilla alba alba]
MISRWRCARVSAGSRRRALPTSPASRPAGPCCPAAPQRPRLGWAEPLCLREHHPSPRLETVNGALLLRKMELESKLQTLKQALHQRWGELRALLARERLLLHGEVNDNALLGALEPAEPSAGGGCGSPGPFLPGKPRFSSESSSRSRLSSMTLGSEDSFYRDSASEDSAAESLSRQSSVDDDCVFRRDGAAAAGRGSLRRNRSISLASSGSASPLWDSGSCSSSFGTLPRKSRRASVRRHLLKFIPGFHRAVEEEESRV